MFTTASENRDYAVKPMNCPGHIQIFNKGLRSYRDLPLRYGEFGSCHRNEPSGALHGLMRVRGFVQDDGHIFCTEDQIQAGGAAFIALLQKVYARLRLHRHHLQARDAPEKRIGSDEPGTRPSALMAGARRRASSSRARAGRGRVLRPEDRVLAEGRASAGSGSAARCRSTSACRAPGRRVRRRGQHAQPR
jgi:threonyl-tRNA synthetase